MGINSRSKGMRGEKQAIGFMEAWTPYEFKRTPGSGGLRGHVTDYTVGDIVMVTPNKICPFTIEVKNYKEINFEHLLMNVNSKVDEFWQQAADDAKRGQKLPLLLLRYNGLPKEFFFVVLYIKHAKIIFRSKPKSLLYGKLLITNTDELIKTNYKKIEPKLLKLL